MEWTSDATMYNGASFVSQGLTAMRYDSAGNNLEHREYLNVSLLEAACGDWRGAVTEDEFAALSCSRSYDDPSDAWQPLPLA
jgi:hypothetical protein